MLSGIHTRPEGLVGLTRAFELGTARVSRRELEGAFRKATANIISYQREKGFTVVMEPCLRWKDPLRPLSSLRGVVVGAGYSRWFTTNTFYKKPLIRGELDVQGNPLASSIYPSLLPKGMGGLAVPGPYTFSQLCEDSHYRDPLKLMKRYALVLSRLLLDVGPGRLAYVQISEPALAFEATRPGREGLEMLREALGVLVEGLGGRVRLALHTFFGSPGDLLPQLMKLPVDYIGVDFVRTSIGELEGVRWTKGLICGFLDAESSYLESVDEIVAFTGELVEALGPPELLLAPNMDLRYLPYSVAQAKLDRLVAAAARLRGMRDAG